MLPTLRRTLATRHLPSRRFSSIRIFDEKERADESLYFSKQDEALLKKIFDASKATEAGESLEMLGESAEDKVKMVFMKHGIPASANPELLRDLVELMKNL